MTSEGVALGAEPGDVQDVARVACAESRGRGRPITVDFDWRERHDERGDFVGLMAAATGDAGR